MVAVDTVWMSYSSLPGQAVEVPIEQVPFWQAKGWYVTTAPDQTPTLIPTAPTFVSDLTPAEVLDRDGVLFRPDGVGGIALWVREDGATTQVGIVGPTGPAGAAGATGAQGAQGATGATGPQGNPGDLSTRNGMAGSGNVQFLASHLGTTWSTTLSGTLTPFIPTAPPPASGFAGTITLVIKQAASGGPFTVTWPAAIEWPNDATGPAMPTVAGAELIVHWFWTGTAWRGIPGGVFFP